MINKITLLEQEETTITLDMGEEGAQKENHHYHTLCSNYRKHTKLARKRKHEQLELQNLGCFIYIENLVSSFPF